MYDSIFKFLWSFLILRINPYYNFLNFKTLRDLIYGWDANSQKIVIIAICHSLHFDIIYRKI